MRDPLLAQLRQGATPEAVSAAVAVAFALAIVPVIGVTTLLCLLAGRLFRLNHIVMQVVNHVSYPLQLILLVPFVRLGETIVGAEPIALSPSALIDEFNQSFGGFVAKFGLAYVHGLLGWILTVPLLCWLAHLLLRRAFRRFAPSPASP
ncbi:MAG: DUF2062 domain-containing protein [Verrucomicrobiota bacterium]